mmetsp:Transcript_13003/g.24620  ORF Transcript_13003/g.24620 Transcript_13003/m.24620 type:complete len:477 (+) Transcript_13003:104-1534(+)|eukprot:CAMPEP_0197473080 /NCGR_PEP_ID=MMETSP1309-20131121/4371_1 /TAXON_ID=464262 /ORGANISM="Genus nov. species nov., Strain RCC998" /LENGTH=476 /DNA_ID=CAMNT_0043012003 /DNA_START=99 /DNA_END=1529 /DNA_ORIENTATION=+
MKLSMSMSMSKLRRTDSKVFKILSEGSRKPTAVGLKLTQSVPFYFGYIIVVIGTLTKAFSAPGQTTTLGALIEYIQADLGMGRSTISVLYTCATLLSSATLPMLGWAMDKFGLRVAGLANASAMAFACLLFSRVTKEAASLTIFFYLLRFLGQGGMQLIGTNLISNWWIRRRGLMQGISGVGLAISMTGLFPIVARMGCESIGWRGTFTVIGVVLLVVFVPLCAIFFCETPEMYGLKPDNSSSASDPLESGKEKVEASLEGKTLGEALRTLDFYAVTGSCLVWALNATGLFFHLTRMIPHNATAQVYLTSSISSATFTLFVGFLFDKINPKWIIAPALLLQSLSIYLLNINMKGLFLTIVAAGIFGASNGCMNNMSGLIHAHLFGRKHLGKISGLAYSCMVTGSALGPLPLGLIDPDNVRQQTTVTYVLSLLPILFSIFVTFCKMNPLVPRTDSAGETKENVEMRHLLAAEDVDNE